MGSGTTQRINRCPGMKIACTFANLGSVVRTGGSPTWAATFCRVNVADAQVAETQFPLESQRYDEKSFVGVAVVVVVVGSCPVITVPEDAKRSSHNFFDRVVGDILLAQATQQDSE